MVLQYQTNQNEPIWSERQLSLDGALVFHMSAWTVSCQLYLTMLLYLVIGSGQLSAHVESRNEDAVSEQVPQVQEPIMFPSKLTDLVDAVFLGRRPGCF